MASALDLEAFSFDSASSSSRTWTWYWRSLTLALYSEICQWKIQTRPVLNSFQGERLFLDGFSNLRCKMYGWDFEFLNLNQFDLYWLNYWHILISKCTSDFTSNTFLIRIQYCYPFIWYRMNHLHNICCTCHVCNLKINCTTFVQAKWNFSIRTCIEN